MRRCHPKRAPRRPVRQKELDSEISKTKEMVQTVRNDNLKAFEEIRPASGIEPSRFGLRFRQSSSCRSQVWISSSARVDPLACTLLLTVSQELLRGVWHLHPATLNEAMEVLSTRSCRQEWPPLGIKSRQPVAPRLEVFQHVASFQCSFLQTQLIKKCLNIVQLCASVWVCLCTGGFGRWSSTSTCSKHTPHPSRKTSWRQTLGWHGCFHLAKVFFGFGMSPQPVPKPSVRFQQPRSSKTPTGRFRRFPLPEVAVTCIFPSAEALSDAVSQIGEEISSHLKALSGLARWACEDGGRGPLVGGTGVRMASWGLSGERCDVWRVTSVSWRGFVIL